jgi:periplasmic divalent cation tolerance protein
MKRPVSPAPTITALTTAPSLEAAKRLVRALVERRVVACGTVVPGAVSIYRWQGAVAEEEEVVVLLKTTAERWPELAATLPGLHPYEVPELLALPVEDGLPAYLEWVRTETGGGTRRGARSSGRRIGSVVPDSTPVRRGGGRRTRRRSRRKKE